jgi:hypothetical protein
MVNETSPTLNISKVAQGNSRNSNSQPNQDVLIMFMQDFTKYNCTFARDMLSIERMR